MQYTEEQRQIIAHPGGHARIIAVAGSGKTQTLTAYVCQRLAQGLNPRRLLVLMYNKAAQLDFERRLRQAAAGQPLPDVRTFHSLGYRICQTLVKQGDLPPFQKELLSDAEMEPIVWRLLRSLADPEQAEDILARKKKWVEPAMAYFELVKSSLDTPEQVFELTGLPDSCKMFIEAFHRFEDWRAEHRRMSFADLLYDPVQRFVREPHLARQFAGHMAEIIVDEFQDINPVQQCLLETLQGDRAALVVVGDPDQTIYEFRGSKPSLLTSDFSQRYPELSDYHLSHTFRFGDQLSLVANQVIAGNYDADHPRTQCVSHDAAADTDILWCAVADSAGAALEQIRTLATQRPLRDIAVINRLWANSARLELLLLANGLPYHMDNQQTVLERHELRPFRLLLQIAAGDSLSWNLKTRRTAWQVLLSQPYLKIKKAQIDQMIQQLAHEPRQWGKALRNAIPDKMSKFQSEALFERARIIDKAERGEGEAYDVIQGWIRATDYFNALRDNAFSAAQVDDQIGTVKAFAQFVRQSGWRLTAGAQRLTELMAQKPPVEVDALLITSIHKSKGREWPVVIIPELNERCYPYQPDGEMMLNTSLASERRLLYVALTRARERLILLTPDKDSEVRPSPFLPEVYVSGARQLLAQVNNGTRLELPSGMQRRCVEALAERKQLGPVSWQARTADTVRGDMLQGATVKHPTLGIGQILTADEDRLVIRFLLEQQERSFARTVVLPLLEILPQS